MTNDDLRKACEELANGITINHPLGRYVQASEVAKRAIAEIERLVGE